MLQTPGCQVSRNSSESTRARPPEGRDSQPSLVPAQRLGQVHGGHCCKPYAHAILLATGSSNMAEARPSDAGCEAGC